MSIQTIAYLKSLFACGKHPSQKDFTDLIDTLAVAAAATSPIDLPYALISTPDYNDGSFRKCNLYGDILLYGPSNPVIGSIWTCYLSVDSVNRNLTFPASVLLPSDSGFTNPKVLTAYLTYVIQMRYGVSQSGDKWCLNTVIGGY